MAVAGGRLHRHPHDALVAAGLAKSKSEARTFIQGGSVAINGAKNAAIYATQILGACDPEYRKVIEKMKQEMADA